MSDQQKFRLVKPFGIDNGELDGASPQQCFVLGYELAMIDERIRLNDLIDMPVHAENRDRIKDSLERCDRPFHLNWHVGDKSETWMWLNVQQTIVPPNVPHHVDYATSDGYRPLVKRVKETAALWRDSIFIASCLTALCIGILLGWMIKT